MTANDTTKVKLSMEENLATKEINITTEGPISFPVALHMTLTTLTSLKEKLVTQIKTSTDEKFLSDRAPGLVYKNLDELKDLMIRKMEGEMYDLINISVGNLLDSAFPTVNENPSLTETAAAEAGLDRNATREDLLKAEDALIAKDPKRAKDFAELKPTQIKNLDNSSAVGHGGLNREQRRRLQKTKS